MEKYVDKEYVIANIKNTKTIDLARKFCVSDQVIIRRLKLWGLYNSNNGNERVKKYNHRFFQNIDNERKAYWLGFIMADGCVYQNCKINHLTIELNSKDYLHLEKFRADINSNKKLYYRKRLPAVKFRLHSIDLCEDLIKLGCTPRKSLTLKFPKIQDDLLRHFIRGYFDGDGSIYFQNDRPNVKFCGTLDFMSNLKELLLLDNKICHYRSLYELHIRNRTNAIKILQYMYDDATVYLDRKFLLYKKAIS